MIATVIEMLPRVEDWVDKVAEATHGGTHVDAPLRFQKGGWSATATEAHGVVLPMRILGASGASAGVVATIP
ncbi:uncharacterized protein LOC142578318 [Dermacentor variabilis]|uniref:uncharacterized protein LOC142578318 n=1 Tax=Dermacentor variabilis TaxID=34621 RepID=UPI003F5C7778